MSPAHGARPRVVAIGGGHGLAASLRACRPWAGELTAIVSVADDGGSSGRLREALPELPAPGDLRRCLTTLASAEQATLAAALERRFESGDLAGHPAGNLLLAALVEETGDLESAAETLAAILGVEAAVLPAAAVAVDLVAATPDGDVRGQVAVEVASGVSDVCLDPPDPQVPKAAIAAVASADLIVIGPGSFYGSVLAAIAAPKLQRAVGESPGVRVLVHNLFAIDSVDDRLTILDRHGVTADAVVVQKGTPGIDAVRTYLVEADVARPNGLAHDPDRLGAVLRDLAFERPE